MKTGGPTSPAGAGAVESLVVAVEEALLLRGASQVFTRQLAKAALCALMDPSFPLLVERVEACLLGKALAS
jgi:hypothetical protein